MSDTNPVLESIRTAVDSEDFRGALALIERAVESGEVSANECLTFIDRAIAVRPDDGNSHYTKACAHALLGQRDPALASVRRAIAVAPSLRFHIAMDDDFASIAGDPEFLEATRARG